MSGRDLIERLVETLESVARDTNYGLHDSDYARPFGEQFYAEHQTDPCKCALCSGREYLSGTENN